MKNDYLLKPVSFPLVQLNDNFWQPRIMTGRNVTLPFAFSKCEETGRFENFQAAAGIVNKKFQGRKYDDSDVFKIIESTSYYLATADDPNLEAYLDNLIADIAAAQEDDGYLYTCRTCHPDGTGDKKTPIDISRWGHLRDDHELYNLGHMYEAAVAHYQATNKKTLLDVAYKSADLVCEVFADGGIEGVPGHQEIELGLVKLYRVSGEEKYLQMAKLFLQRRGQHKYVTPAGDDVMREDFTEFNQDHKPVVEQDEAVGHSVRALYMYSGMTDIAALTNDENFIKASKAIWDNIVDKKLYITGGTGSLPYYEGFGSDFELPNNTAYNETCASIANMFFNYRLFLMTGEAKYINVFERILYNGFLSGYSLDGQHFFYPNPLESDGVYPFNRGQSATRRPWFETSCCPSNILRFLPSLPGYVYATLNDALYVNLYIANEAKVELGDTQVAVKQQSNYPWNSDISFVIDPEVAKSFTLKLRLPDWVQGTIASDKLYHFVNGKDRTLEVALEVNGTPVELVIENGYLCIEREWHAGDRVKLVLPMETELVKSHKMVEANRHRLSIQRGPQMYCIEEADNPGLIQKYTVTADTEFSLTSHESLLGEHGIALKSPNFTAIPYWSWSNRGEGQMQVWLNKTRKCNCC